MSEDNKSLDKPKEEEKKPKKPSKKLWRRITGRRKIDGKYFVVVKNGDEEKQVEVAPQEELLDNYQF